MPKKLVVDRDWLVAQLRNGRLVKDIAAGLGTTHKTLNRAMRDLGVVSASLRFQHDFFHVINTEQKAYWLGYIMADGCVTTTQSNRIEITSKDVEHLHKWHRAIGSTHKVLISYGVYGKSVHCSSGSRIF